MKYTTVIKSLIEDKILTIFIISSIFFSIKWCISFYFINEDLIVKILFESVSDGSFFYPIIKFLSEGDLSNSLNPLITDLKTITVPFGSVIIHTIFYKIFGLHGLIIVDFFGIFLFFIIFYKIFLFFNSKNNSIFFTLILFSLPLILNVFFQEHNSLPISQFKKFYTLRVHRPFPANLYMFGFIYLILLMNKETIFKKNYFLILGVLMALSFSSFYYYFILEILLFSFFLIYKLKNEILKQILENYKCILILFVSFLIVSFPFIYNLRFSEPDIANAGGLYELSFAQKIYLINHLFFKIFNTMFILFNLMILYLSYKINKKNIIHSSISNIFNFIYLSAILSPFLFVVFSPKISLLFHFNNNIVVYGVLSLSVSLIIIVQSKFKFNFNSLFLFIFIFFLSCLNIFNQINKIEQNKGYIGENQLKEGDVSVIVAKDIRSEFNKIVEIINSKSNVNSLNSLLTFDERFMKWAILNDKIDYLNLTQTGHTPKNYNLVENDLINSFKFLGLDSNDFIVFLENRKRGWRYLNRNVQIFFLARYTANSLITYNDSKKFLPEIKNFILQSSPLYHQQLAIPLNEFSRLEKKFNLNIDKIFFEPKIIILSNDLKFIDNVEINKDHYCNIFKGNNYTLFIFKHKNVDCDVNFGK